MTGGGQWGTDGDGEYSPQVGLSADLETNKDGDDALVSRFVGSVLGG